MTPPELQPGQVIQVSARSAIATGALIRVQRACRYTSTPDDHVWVDGYVLDPVSQDALCTRTVFLALFHLRVVEQAPARRRPTNAGPVVPRQRTATRPAVRPR
jgi:hypothetical protein